MVARLILDLAPDARLYDVPVVPDRIRDVNAAASDFAAAYELLVPLVTVLRHFPKYQGSWIIVNAWAIFDRTTEDPLGDYTQDSHPTGHDLNTVIAKATDDPAVIRRFADESHRLLALPVRSTKGPRSHRPTHAEETP